MSTLTNLDALVQQFGAVVPPMGLDDDNREEYSTVLLRLLNTVESGEPNERIVNECLAYLRRFGFPHGNVD